tara:strand:+ start:3322 stop:3531 length:210 start_codon:yes stop_codon:yes gene_type:complete
MGDFLDRLKQRCPSCWQLVLAKRIEGRYVNQRTTRILIWECTECGTLWQKPRRPKDLSENERSLIADSE